MTDKKRLEEIEKNLDPLGYGMGGHLISVNDIYWLVRYAKEQSERVQELEEEIRRIRQMKYHEAYEQGKFDTNMKVWYEVPELEQQNKRYQKVIKECLERMNEGGAGTRSFVYEKLIEVLEGESNELG